MMAASSSASDRSAHMDPKTVAQDVRATYEADDEEYEMAEGAVARKWQGTDADRKDMSQLGRVQELRRNFQFLGILGFACTLIATWEVVVTTLTTSFTNGGTAGLLWGFIIVFIGFSFVYLSVAEMVSMAPTSGGQYRKYQRPRNASAIFLTCNHQTGSLNLPLHRRRKYSPISWAGYASPAGNAPLRPSPFWLLLRFKA